MTRMATFSANTLREAVNHCNDFLTQHPTLNIINVSTSTYSFDNGFDEGFVITLLYKTN